jgi:carboxyl-terminal processing protease
LPETLLVAQFAQASLESLDPYTIIVWPRRIEEFEKAMTNTFTGIGVEITDMPGKLTVVSLLLDTPAFNSGLIDAGDVIEAVDGLQTKDMTINCAVQKITGPAGTKVVLTIKSPDEDKSREITLTRAKVIVPTIRGWQRTEAGKWRYMIDRKDKIGYIRITSFSGKTHSDFEKVLDKLESDGLKALILDLRFNPGGHLDAAYEIADEFIEKGLIVSTRPRFGLGKYYSAEKKGTRKNYPLVVLINSHSASASEIVAGALGDPKYNRAILVGERTHGKSSVQTVSFHPGGGAQLKYTMAYYYLPSGKRVETKAAMKKAGRDDWGVAPDVEIKLRSDELKKLFDVRKDNDVLVKVNHNKNSLNKHTIEETLASDPQLKVAALIAKTKLIQSAAKK